MQLLKSISATFVVVAGRAFNGAAVESFAVVCSGGVAIPAFRRSSASPPWRPL